MLESVFICAYRFYDGFPKQMNDLPEACGQAALITKHSGPGSQNMSL